MPNFRFQNNVSMALAEALSASDVTMTVAENKIDGFAPGSAVFALTLTNPTMPGEVEIVLWSGFWSGSSYSVERGAEGTSPIDWPIAGTAVEVRLTASALNLFPQVSSDPSTPIAIGANDGATLGAAATAVGRVGAVTAGDAATLVGAVTGDVADSGTAVGVVSQVVGASAVAMGHGPRASGSGSVAVGKSPRAEGANSIAIGTSAQADSASGASVVLGDSAQSNGADSIVIGPTAQANQDNSVAIGSDAQISASSGVAVGKGTRVTAANSVAVGISGQVYADNCVAVGASAIAAVERSVAIGKGANAAAPATTAVGADSQAVAPGTIAFGPDTLASMPGAVAIGSKATAHVQNGLRARVLPYVNAVEGDWAEGAWAQAGVPVVLAWPTMELGVADSWQASTSYPPGSVVRAVAPDAWQYLLPKVPGFGPPTSGTTEPAWVKTSAGAVTPDNGCNWSAMNPGAGVMLALPGDATLFVDELIFVCDERGAVSAEPAISLGATGAPTALLNSAAMPATTAGQRIRIPITSGAGLEGSISLTLDTAAVGGSLRGRFYARGVLLGA